jgi:hypothetical protein
MTYTPTIPTLTHLLRAEIELGAIEEIGETPLGRRRVIPILGGSFTGEQLAGAVLPGGADWQLVRPDGVVLLDARYILRTNDGSLIYIHNRGVRHGPPAVLVQLARGEAVDPVLYYFRTTPLFETGAAQYNWLNNLIAVASGLRQQAAIVLDVYAVR